MLIILPDNNEVKEIVAFTDIGVQAKIEDWALPLIQSFLVCEKFYGIFSFLDYQNTDELKYHTIMTNSSLLSDRQSVTFIYIQINNIKMSAVLILSDNLEYVLVSEKSIDELKNNSDLIVKTELDK